MAKREKTKRRAAGLWACGIFLLIILTVMLAGLAASAGLSITVYSPRFNGLPDAFDGFKIAHVSDLHNKDFGGRLELEIAKRAPDIIVITGDIVHEENSYSHALAFVKNAADIAPVFYVNGNHEADLRGYPAFTALLRKAGAVVLENEVFALERGERRVALIGINDAAFFTAPENGKRKDALKKELESLCAAHAADFKILLSHRPEFFDIYAGCGIGIAFAGHAHGGQIRLPLIGALYAPGQGLFPKYADGLKKRGDSYMAVSRGLGKTPRVPPRTYNKPELVFVNLTKE
jgi:predicted MPP superfamily phosphohydrolase